MIYNAEGEELQVLNSCRIRGVEYYLCRIASSNKIVEYSEYEIFNNRNRIILEKESREKPITVLDIENNISVRYKNYRHAYILDPNVKKDLDKATLMNMVDRKGINNKKFITNIPKLKRFNYHNNIYEILVEGIYFIS